MPLRCPAEKPLYVAAFFSQGEEIQGGQAAEKNERKNTEKESESYGRIAGNRAPRKNARRLCIAVLCKTDEIF